jgi:integrase
MQGRRMSVYKDARSPFYQYDFRWRGHRFFGSTKVTDRREAEKVERTKRDEAKRIVAQESAAKTSLRLDDVAGRYWQDVGQHHAGADNTERLLDMVVGYLGEDTLITDITGDDIAKLRAWRRGHKRKDGALISAFTVNDTIEQVKKLFTHLKGLNSNLRFEHEPKWKNFWLPEPKERMRELHDDEAGRLDDAMREDWGPFFMFERASGLRLNECVTLRWTEVHWEAREITKEGKGGKVVTVPITPEIRAILWPLRGHHREFVFTYVAKRTRGKRVRGTRYRITYNGAKTQWRRLCKRAKVVGFRFHDHRHDIGTKVLRSTGNLKLAQRVLNHADIRSTVRYAHVIDNEVRAAFESYQESRKKSRSTVIGVRHRVGKSA